MRNLFVRADFLFPFYLVCRVEKNKQKNGNSQKHFHDLCFFHRLFCMSSSDNRVAEGTPLTLYLHYTQQQYCDMPSG